MLHSFFPRFPSLAGVLLVVVLLEMVVRLGVVVVFRSLGEVVARPSLAPLSVACGGVEVSQKDGGTQSNS
jgi:hypothetical protein